MPICNSPGWNECVLSVENLDNVANLYAEVAGWVVVSRCVAHKSLARFWKLPEDTVIHEVLMANPRQNFGSVRLVKFENIKQQQIRPSARFWDVGGISNVSSRVLCVEESFGKLQRMGWSGHHQPVPYQFGPFKVIEGLTSGHDGVTFSLVERLAPPLSKDDDFGHFSIPFNAPQVVGDFDAALDWYKNKLGFELIVNAEITWEAPGDNVFGLPYNIAMNQPVKSAVLQPKGVMAGAIEILGPGILVSKDFSERAVPPNLGILALRFPVENLDEYIDAIVSNGVSLEQELTEIYLPPYGAVRACVVRSPNGSWMEFYQPRSAS